MKILISIFFLLFFTINADFVDTSLILKVEEKYGKFVKNRFIALNTMLEKSKNSDLRTKLEKINDFFNDIEFLKIVINSVLAYIGQDGFDHLGKCVTAQLFKKIPNMSPDLLEQLKQVILGYDDNIKIKNALPESIETKGALLIRNSWGPAWGHMGGYLWMPYDYITKGVAKDFWTLISANYINTGMFNV